MSLIVTEGSSKMPPIPEDVYAATCVGLYDIGEHRDEKYDKTAKKVIIVWEVDGATYPDSETKEERNRTISSTYTLSLNDRSKLRALLKSWRGQEFTPEELKGFDLKNVLGAPCQLQIIHTERDGNTYANISTVMKLPKITPKPTPQNELVYFDLDVADEEAIAAVPEWIQKRIKDSITYKLKFGEQEFSELDDGDGDLPF